MTFEELGLGPKVLQAVADAGYTTPTPIQEQAIPHVLARKDVLGIAQTGTGKTASFTLPMIELLGQGRAKARMPRTLILTPTRELAAQIAENFVTYGKYHKLTMALLIGGVSFDEQNKKLDRGVDVLIATPGRLLDQFERGRILLSGIEVFVVDEADRMLDMGFIPDLEKIFKMLPFTRQTLFFSATMPAEIQRLTESYLFAPARIEVARQATTAESIAQEVIHCERTDKRAALRAILETQEIKNAIIFCNRKRDVDILERSLRKHGYSTAALHGDLDQGTRTKTLERFKSGEVRLLVASDVAARGLDIPAVSHIFNFDVPGHPEDYVHRIGRTGRAGLSGHAYTIVAPDDRKSLKAVEALLKKPIPVIKIDGLKAAPAESTPAPAEAEKPARARRRGGRGRTRRASTDTVTDEKAETPTVEAPAAPVETAPLADTPDAATVAPDTIEKTPDETKPRRRGRRGGRGRRRSSGGQAAKTETAADDTTPTEAATDAPKTDHKPAPKPEAKAEPKQETERKAGSRQPRARGGRNRDGNRDEKRDNKRGGNKEPEKVKPSVDELPAFLFRSID